MCFIIVSKPKSYLFDLLDIQWPSFAVVNTQCLMLSQERKASLRGTCLSLNIRDGAMRRRSAGSNTRIWSAWGTRMRTSWSRRWCRRALWCSSACLKMFSDGQIKAAPHSDAGLLASLMVLELVLSKDCQIQTHGPIRTVLKQDRSSAKTVSCSYVRFSLNSPWNGSSNTTVFHIVTNIQIYWKKNKGRDLVLCINCWLDVEM